MNEMKGIGQLPANEPVTYDDDDDDDESACDVQLARQVVHALSRAWAFAHCDLAPNFG